MEEAEAKLKEKDAPPSSGGTSAGTRVVGVTSTKKNMFEALEPTDIVVVGREPASVRKVDSSGKPVSAKLTIEADRTASEPQQTRKLFAHDDHHRDTVLRVWTESDTIEYQCDEKFEIVGVERAGWKIYDAPDNPFGNGRPYRAQEWRPREKVVMGLDVRPPAGDG